MADDRLGRILDEVLAGDLPANVALMRLLVEARRPEDVAAALAESTADGEAAARLDALRALHEANPGAGATVRAVMARARHDVPVQPEQGVAQWAAIFDDLAVTEPEAGVALYGLGSAELLAAATDEVVARMREWGLTGLDHRLVDFGCGIGRLSLALAPHVASVVGLDVSAAMVAEARRRGEGVANARFEQSSGRDLAAIPDASVEMVLAADVFPYLVAAGPDLPGRLAEEAARVLKPGGALLILNYSYRGDPDRDRREALRLFETAGLATERDGTRDLALWDGSAWLGRKRA